MRLDSIIEIDTINSNKQEERYQSIDTNINQKKLNKKNKSLSKI